MVSTDTKRLYDISAFRCRPGKECGELLSGEENRHGLVALRIFIFPPSAESGLKCGVAEKKYLYISLLAW
jgi:hypothetical protein